MNQIVWSSETFRRFDTTFFYVYTVQRGTALVTWECGATQSHLYKAFQHMRIDECSERFNMPVKILKIRERKTENDTALEKKKKCSWLL